MFGTIKRQPVGLKANEDLRLLWKPSLMKLRIFVTGQFENIVQTKTNRRI